MKRYEYRGEDVIIMEEYVDKLALLQAHRKTAEDVANNNQDVRDSVRVIAILESQIAEERERLSNRRGEYDTRISEIDDEIKHVSAQIINEWTGDKKTLAFDSGTLNFTTRGNLKVIDDVNLFIELYEHLAIENLVKTYLKGFNLTAVKKYMGVHDLPTNVAEIEYKTIVKMEQDRGE